MLKQNKTPFQIIFFIMKVNVTFTQNLSNFYTGGPKSFFILV